MNEVPTGLQVAASSRSWDWLQIKCVLHERVGRGRRCRVSGVGARFICASQRGFLVGKLMLAL